ncbi:hypothetical protein E4582_06995 [Luteimonas yindakuii]|uniref:Uncharacterized protein n=1 Tax=Luteimonas yindakuii TaxID=2565782 RepID=A0A4Z1RIH6_9GAMM|nr:hypothetical protein [Luteimonas yindakuii]QCO68159.2 hypothetical protein E5843_11040 [Luteimonas yindakuii]TKS54527.1 hypothetical protein E4582_06995 [Luteimonas yindakuii]
MRVVSRWVGAGLATVALALVLAACLRSEPDASPLLETLPVASPEDGGAFSVAPVEEDTSPQADAPPAPEPPAAVDWSELPLEAGTASISCELDYLARGDGEPLADLSRSSIEQALESCEERGVMRLRYDGRIAPDFTALVERVATVADERGVGKRVLDINSIGGQVEEAIRAGDLIAESRWTIWVREGSSCHSACVFVLAGGDTRLITGRVGIHRIIRMSSTATTRVELNAELRAVYDRVRSYLERNGAAVAVADAMMAVPNRSLRLLTGDELRLFGLDGVNPAQDDLDRLRLMRKCGEDFVTRRDSFTRAFDLQCKSPITDLDALNACGLDLRQRFGFPDETCPAESPLSEFDVGTGLVLAPPTRSDAVGQGGGG